MMIADKQKWANLLDYYEQHIENLFPGIEPERRSNNNVAHIKAMFPQMRVHLVEKPKKFMRWFGFLQGWMWSVNLFTIEEMGKHNKNGV